MIEPPAHGAVYSGRATNWPMLWLSTALGVPFLAMAHGSASAWTAPDLLPVAFVLLVVAVNVLTATSVRVLSGPRGVSVHFGVLGWPRFRYPTERIRSAEAVDVPGSVLAWGIAWSPRRGLMLTLRNGPALRLVLTNGRRITISTPDPAAAVRVLARPAPLHADARGSD